MHLLYEVSARLETATLDVVRKMSVRSDPFSAPGAVIRL